MTAQIIRVAILDDDPSIRAALVRFLQAEEMVAHAYATSGELFASIALKCPDCLLLDLQMPEMNGRDVLKLLNQRSIRIPTIIITGSGASACRLGCSSAGAIACLDKPLDTEQLIQLIRTISKSPQPDTPAYFG